LIFKNSRFVRLCNYIGNNHRLALAFTTLAFTAPSTAQISTTNIDFPGASQTVPTAISNNGYVAGYYYDTSLKPFIWFNGSFTTLQPPFTNLRESALPGGINNTEQVVGNYVDSNCNSHGWLYSNGTYTTVDSPDTAFNQSPPGLNSCTLGGTGISNINDQGEILTQNFLGSFLREIHLYNVHSGSFQVVAPPPSPNNEASSCLFYSTAFGINDSNIFAGSCVLTAGSFTFLYNYATQAFELFPVPAGFNVGAVNDSGIVLATNYQSSFLLSSSTAILAEVTLPGATNIVLYGLNDSGAMVGTYQDTATGLSHGVLIATSQPTASIRRELLGGPGSTTNPTASIAEPINTATGNFYSSQTDLAIKGLGLPLVFNRYYNSLDQTSGPLGIGWTHSYNLSLSANSATGLVTIRQQDGSAVTFQSGANGTFVPMTTGLHDSLLAQADGSFTLRRTNQTTLHFSSAGALMNVVDRNGNTQTLSYNSSGDLSSITDTVGRVVTFDTDASHHLLSMIDVLGRKVSYGYDGAGHLISVTEPDGGVTTYTYDASNRLLTGTDARGVTYVQNGYDSQGRVITQKNGRGITTTLAYGSPTVGTTTVTDGNENTLQHTYDSNLRIIRMVDGAGAATFYGYDGNNNRTSITDANGNVTSLSYSSGGNLQVVKNALAEVTSFTYDALNDLTSITDPAGNVSRLTYDQKGNLLVTADALGDQTTIARDQYGEIIAVTDPLAHVSRFSWDARGNLIAAIDASGRQRTFVYDKVGRRVKVIDGLGDTRTTQYDALNRVTERIDAVGDTTQVAYDPLGSPVSITDANGNITRYGYDANEKLIQLVDALGNKTAYSYDGNNNLIASTNARGKTTSYAYDPANRPVSVTDPLGRVRQVTYDGIGNVVSSTDGNGATSLLSYDALERSTGVTYADGSSVSLSYDFTGNLTQVSDALGTSTYDYDALHRLTSQRRAPSDLTSSVVRYAYDAAGRRTAILLTPGESIQRTYDPAGRLTAVSDWLGHTTTYAYDAAGRLLKTQFPNRIASNYTHDAAGRLTNITTASSSRLIDAFEYSLDNVGNRVAVESPTDSATYAYDALSRLTTVSGARGGDFQYSYDADGNRLTALGAGQKVTYVYDAADQMLSAGSVSFAYDSNGSLISRRRGDYAVKYSWDAAGRLSRVTQSTFVTHYSYDGMNRRLARLGPLATHNYLYEEGSALPMLLMQGTVPPSPTWKLGQSTTDIFINGVGVASAIRGNAQGAPADVDYIHQDALGSTVAVTDTNGHVEQSSVYSPWGMQIGLQWPPILQNEQEVPFKFTGQIADPSDGLVYMRARYYDPSIGRFISKDPRVPGVANAWDRNPYVYARNNPASFRDPSGRSATVGSIPDATRSGADAPASGVVVSVAIPVPFGKGTSVLVTFANDATLIGASFSSCRNSTFCVFPTVSIQNVSTGSAEDLASGSSVCASTGAAGVFSYPNSFCASGNSTSEGYTFDLNPIPSSSASYSVEVPNLDGIDIPNRGGDVPMTQPGNFDEPSPDYAGPDDPDESQYS
jgi:RHS repeat-associated protein